MSSADNPSNTSQSLQQQPFQHLELDTKEAIQQAVLKIIELTRREIIVVLPTFHHALDSNDIYQAFIHFITDSPKREIMIILNNLADQQPTSHALVRLAQRLSRVKLKQVTHLIELPIKDTDYLFICDHKHFLRIDQIEQNHAWLNLDYAPRAIQLIERIMPQWHTAQEIKEFRQFML